MTQFSAEKYHQSVTYYSETWQVMDNSLYRLCRDNPGHSSMSAACAKLWIIGRTYATGIERAIATTGKQGSSMTQVAEFFLKHSGSIESWFEELRPLVEPLDSEKLCKIVSIHGRLVHLLRPITRRNQSTRSFVSKYMHFHNPTVPIYDSVASAALRRLMRWNNSFSVFSVSPDADDEFAYYLMRFFALYEKIRTTRLPVSVRYVDHYLLSLAESSYTATRKPT
jgi:hypothetical protein